MPSGALPNPQFRVEILGLNCSIFKPFLLRPRIRELHYVYANRSAAVDLPTNVEPDPAAAAIVQELLGGKFGEMSTLNNYLYQSFNMRGRNDIIPFYDLVSSIAAEELGHIELVAATINLLQNGAVPDGKTPADAPLAGLNGGNGLRHQFVNNGHSALVADSGGMAWRGDYVFNSGNLVLDMLHNFFLESGARMGKLRVYESSNNPVVKRLTGYLLCWGGRPSIGVRRGPVEDHRCGRAEDAADPGHPHG